MHRQGQTLPGRGLIDAMQQSKSIKARKSYFAYQPTAITIETPSHQSLWPLIGQEDNKVCEETRFMLPCCSNVHRQLMQAIAAL